MGGKRPSVSDLLNSTDSQGGNTFTLYCEESCCNIFIFLSSFTLYFEESCCNIFIFYLHLHYTLKNVVVILPDQLSFNFAIEWMLLGVIHLNLKVISVLDNFVK